MNPFSDNIIFVDTEFSDLNPYKGEILSIGLVKPNGEENPFFWLPIDFASMLFAAGRDPENCCDKSAEEFYEKVGIDISKYRKHHALDDAKLLREVYLKMVGQ